MADVVMEINGLDDLIKNIDTIPEKFRQQIKDAMGSVADKVAQNIQVTFTGGRRPGFGDRTGALRGSIKGGLAHELSEGVDIVGFVSAGDDSLGSEGRATREYVKYVEFGEFIRPNRTLRKSSANGIQSMVKTRSTSFLRSGVQMLQRDIANMLAKEVNLEALV